MHLGRRQAGAGGVADQEGVVAGPARQAAGGQRILELGEERLVHHVERLAGETLVYDLRRHRAHCLNPAATLVWRCCDGRTTVASAAARLAFVLVKALDLASR